MKSEKIRQRFLQFFEDHGHRRIPSAPLLPSDPNLLFNIAGMVPFKPYFLGEESPPDSRVTSTQKCLRTEDIDQVGYTARHLTFFEMLGNFSFGDYFKEKAIGFAWEFFVDELELNPEFLYVSVFGGDQEESLDPDREARRFWLEQTDIPEDRILELGTDENFWKMGSTGPCGPCSEILYDQGTDRRAPDQVKESILAGKDRYLELWNLVFIQYNRSQDGGLTTLPRQNIDTGLGLERLSAILQGAEHNFDTDLFRPLIDRVRQSANLPPLDRGEPANWTEEPGMVDFPERDFSRQQMVEQQRAGRIIADHVRASSFLLSEGLIPGNEGRGYVLRRIIRRALIWGRKLGFEEPFLHRFTTDLVGMMGEAYPELKENQSIIEKRLKQEEEQFLATLKRSMDELQVRIERVLEEKGDSPNMGGKELFEMYETYGLPVEMTQEILDQHGVSYDPEEVEQARQQHREQSSGTWEQTEEFSGLANKNLPPTKFVGYDSMSHEVTVQAIFRDGGSVDSLQAGQEGLVVVDETPFYPEGGGQVGDSGTIGPFDVQDTFEQKEAILHKGMANEVISTGDSLQAQVDVSRRRDTMRHHTATHLLQAALREELGDGVMQNGSLVDSEHLRFDFTYGQKVPPETLNRIEQKINDWIYREYPVTSTYMDREQAENRGALAFFGEHYGEEVRVVEIGDISAEFCGGTHLENSSELGLFTITDEQSVAAGIRRIEARAGRPAVKELRSTRNRLRDLIREIGVQTSEDVLRRFTDLREQLDEAQRELESLRKQKSAKEAERVADNARVAGNRSYVIEHFKNRDSESLKTMVDEVKSKLDQGIVLLINEQSEAVQLFMGVTDDLTDEIHAGDWVGEFASLVGGGGGGRPDFAQAGGSDVSSIDQVKKTFQKKIKDPVHSGS